MGFSIRASNYSWINGADDDPEDLCLHGDVTAVIGTRIIEYKDATVSASALYHLKTLTEDHIIHAGNQMIPCCGFFMIPSAGLDNVTIMGCDSGEDWTVLHEGGDVVLELDDGTLERVPLTDYRQAVFRFADSVEAFYRKCTPKKPRDDFDRIAYRAFWNEWHRRRNA